MRDVTYLRRAMLRGLPVLAYDAARGELAGEVAEAARLTGRLDRLRTIRMGRRASAATARFRAGCRRIGPEALPSAAALSVLLETLPRLEDFDPVEGWPEPSRMPGETVRLRLEGMARPAEGTCVLPELDLRDATDARALVVLEVPYPTDESWAYFEWLALEAVRAAQSEGRPAPIVFYDVTEPRRTSSLRRIRTWKCGAAMDRPMACGHAEAIASLCMPDIAEGVRWKRLEAASPRPFEGNGIAYLREGMRAVVARSREGAGTRSFLVHEIEDGYVTALGFSGCPMGDVENRDVLSELCGLAWRRGLRAIEDHLSLFGRAPEAAAAPAGSLASHEGYPDVPAEVTDGIVDPALARAASAGRDAESVLRLARGHGRRRDFAIAFPALSHLLHDPVLRKGVDGGEEAVDLVSRALGVTPAIARRLVGVTLHPATCHTPFGAGGEGARPLGAVLAAVGHDRMPSRGDGAEWEAFAGCVDAALGAFSRYGGLPVEALARALAVPGKDWRSRLGRIEATGTRAEDVGDVVRQLAHVMKACGAAMPTYHAAARMLQGHGRVDRLFAAVAAWHADPDLSAAAGMPPAAARWPVPFGEAGVGPGWSCRPIGSMRELRDEGNGGRDADGIPGLWHCVAGLGQACARGEAIVLSLRRMEGDAWRRVSTAELRPSKEGTWDFPGRAYGLVQHRGLRNADPGNEAHERLEALRLAIGAGRVPVDVAALRPRGIPDPVPSHEGMAPSELLRRWDPVLPPGLRGLGPRRFAEAAGTYGS